jgi:predicted pyridoxine 5'-phosphate oxidase superfamily flavin-nucleotide-binding protein
VQALLSLDVSSLTGSDLVHMISKRSATRANLAPYSWGDLNEVAGPRTLGRADRARNDELARVAALLQDDDSLAFLVKSSASNVKNK